MGHINMMSSQKTMRVARASRGQRVEDFMDDDELAEAEIATVQPTAEYDTFGSTAAEKARRQAQAEASARADGQLSFLPDDIIAPVADSMGTIPILGVSIQSASAMRAVNLCPCRCRSLYIHSTAITRVTLSYLSITESPLCNNILK